MKNPNDYPLWTAIVTPFKQDGEFDRETFTKLCKAQETADNALVVLGSTGEALAMGEEERLTILQTALDLKLSVPLMVGVGGFNLAETKSWVAKTCQLGVDACLLVTPLYAKPGTQGQIKWFQELLDTATVPCMLYNVPGRTAVKMAPEVLSSLKNHKNFWAVKEASGSPEEFSAYREQAPDKAFYSGDDALTPEFSRRGGQGLVSVASNIWPKAVHRYTRLCVTGEITKEEEALWESASNSLFIASNPIPAKRLLKVLGQIPSDQLRAPLTQEDLTDHSQLEENHKKIQSWFESRK